MKYLYNGKSFADIDSLRQYMWAKEHVALSANVSDEFLAEYGVQAVEDFVGIEPNVDLLRQRKLVELTENFNRMRNNPGIYVNSSLGFRADSNVVALTDVEGLIHILTGEPEETTVQFRDYDNEFRTLNIRQLQILAKEISMLATIYYQQKWMKQTELYTSQTVDELEQVNLNFADTYPLA